MRNYGGIAKIFGWGEHFDGGNYRKPSKVYEGLRKRWEAHKGAVELSRDSRQQISARIRRETFAKINKEYGPEPRKARRGIAMTLARKIRKGFIAGLQEREAAHAIA